MKLESIPEELRGYVVDGYEGRELEEYNAIGCMLGRRGMSIKFITMENLVEQLQLPFTQPHSVFSGVDILVSGNW